MADDARQRHDARGFISRRVDPAQVTPGTDRPGLVPDPYLFGSVMFETTGAAGWDPHRHAHEHQLLWPVTGVLMARAGGRAWQVLPGQGAWFRAGDLHTVSVRGPARFGITYLRSDVARFRPEVSGSTVVVPALRELLIHMNRERLDLASQLRFQQVCIDLFRPANDPILAVPLPDDPRIAPMVSTLLDDCADSRSIEQWAEFLGLSSRTVARAMTASVGMSFGRWRRLLRMRDAYALLADGESVSATAWLVGYLSTSAFIAAFRDVTGVTPTAVASDSARGALLAYP
ncbi:helix-turn-helix domain-containing protein [Microbacterium suaedae]|uniref:helix-turn-helix domain-containing protein n=1 Tax=Microbacterium suaedae TaxID=2067813 RepID=UPI000DA169A3|nr:AraC family transcriptional regulator [Microbacterium suaedae]